MTAVEGTTTTCPVCTHHVAVYRGYVSLHRVDGKDCDGVGLPAPARQTLKVPWHPAAVTRAVERLAAIVASEGFNPDGAYQVEGSPISGQDLMCLVDVGRSILSESGDAS